MINVDKWLQLQLHQLYFDQSLFTYAVSLLRLSQLAVSIKSITVYSNILFQYIFYTVWLVFVENELNVMCA